MNEKSNLHQVEHERVMHYKYLIMFLRILSMHRCQDHYMGSPKAGGTMINPFSHFKRINSPHTSIHPSFLSTLPSSWVKVQLSFVVLSLSAPLQSLRGLVLDWGRARVGGNVGEIEQVLPPLTLSRVHLFLRPGGEEVRALVKGLEAWIKKKSGHSLPVRPNHELVDTLLTTTNHWLANSNMLVFCTFDRNFLSNAICIQDCIHFTNSNYPGNHTQPCHLKHSGVWKCPFSDYRDEPKHYNHMTNIRLVLALLL